MMRESTARRVQAWVLGAIVVLMSLVFLTQFGGPQAEGCSLGGAGYAAKVHGETISEGDFRASYTLAGFQQTSTEEARRYKLREHTLNGLIERELLARQARELGFTVSEEDVWRHVAEKGTAYVTMSVDAAGTLPSGGEVPIPVKNRDGEFDMTSTKRFIQMGLRRSIREFSEGQAQEMLADHMRRTFASTVRISSHEVWDAWVRERETATLKYVRFSPSYYRETLAVTPADVDRWAGENRAEVDREYTRQRHRYTGLEKQARARHILIKAEEGAAEDIRAAARARIDGLLARARAGEDFAALARDNSEDPGSARRGGDLGYNARGRMVPAFDEAMFNLQPGAISDVVETQFGFHVIKLEGFREGDVPEAEARREIAEELYRSRRGDELAQEAADQAMRDLTAGLTLDQLDRRLRGLPETPVPDQPEPDPSDESALGPHVQETRPFGRSDTPIPGAPSEAAALTRAAFELDEENPMPRAPMRVGSDWIVFRLENRVRATEAEFTDEERTRLREALLRAKQQEAIALYVRQLRRDADRDSAIRINDEILNYDAPPEDGEEGQDEPEEEESARAD
jgi:peptidyl-prolyl cis-trans isomerase D